MKGITLKFINNFPKNRWFIKNKFKEAEKVIGKKRFAYIMNQNIPNCCSKNKRKYKTLKQYLAKHKKEITFDTKQKGGKLEKRWKKFEKDFFQQMEVITGIKWKYKIYKAYLLFGCFWGGDYDINKANIYINPLLKHGDPLYVIFHELSHLIYWEYICLKYPHKFIKRHFNLLWRLSEVMVNYPLLKMRLDFRFPLIMPANLNKFGQKIIKKFKALSYISIIDSAVNIKKRAE